jgi:hypothetical protein
MIYMTRNFYNLKNCAPDCSRAAYMFLYNSNVLMQSHTKGIVFTGVSI